MECLSEEDDALERRLNEIEFLRCVFPEAVAAPDASGFHIAINQANEDGETVELQVQFSKHYPVSGGFSCIVENSYTLPPPLVTALHCCTVQCCAGSGEMALPLIQVHLSEPSSSDPLVHPSAGSAASAGRMVQQPSRRCHPISADRAPQSAAAAGVAVSSHQ